MPRSPSAENEADAVPGVLLSIAAIAREFGISRETLRGRLEAAGVTPAGKRRGNALFRLRDAYQAVVAGPDSPIRPEAMSPFQRKAHFQAAQEELRYLQECGRLMLAEDFQAELGRVAKIFIHGCDTLPDVLERSVGLDPPQVQAAVDHCNKFRDEIAAQLRSEADAP